MDKEEYRDYYLSVYRHSLAHVMAKAVMEIFGKENVQIAIGPQIADGFYYDFMLPRTITNDDYKTIEDKMREILKRREDWTVKEVSKEEALEIFKGQKYKEELINDLGPDEKITIYYTGDDFVDLCRGPHISNSQELMNAAFKVKSVSGSYWRGDEHNDQLQRVYMYAFSICSCSMRQRLVCHTGSHVDSRCTTLSLTSGETFMRNMVIRRFCPLLSTTRIFGRHQVTGDTIRKICSL